MLTEAAPFRTSHLPATTELTGDETEGVAAKYLESQNHTIIARAWKTKICEIDIVSRLGDTIYYA